SRRRHTRFSRDWSSDVCSSDLAGGDSRWSGVEGGDEDDAVGVAVDAGAELARLVLDGAGVAFVVAGDGVDEQVTSGGQLVLGEGQTAGLGAHWDLLSGGGSEDVEQVPHVVRGEAEVCGDVAPHEITGAADEGGEEASRAGRQRDVLHEAVGGLAARLGGQASLVTAGGGHGWSPGS